MATAWSERVFFHTESLDERETQVFFVQATNAETSALCQEGEVLRFAWFFVFLHENRVGPAPNHGQP